MATVPQSGSDVEARVGAQWLTGGWEPVDDELTTEDLPVTGTLPEALRGSYLRNGPNPAFAPLGAYHLFDGDGMVHAVELDGGRARYRNRWIRSKGLEAERRAGRALFGGLAEFRLPDEEVLAEVGPLKNVANTHVWRHAGRVLALLEAAKPTEITLELDTVGEHTFDGRLHGPMTAHPKTDPETGELLFFGYAPFPPFLRFHVAAPTGELVTSVDIDLPAAVMMHDFAVSRDRVVFFDLPAVFDLDAMLSGAPGIRWEPGNGARLGVLERARPDAGVRWFDVDPFWMFHVLNAHDDGSSVVVEACRTDRLNTTFGGDTEQHRAAPPTLHRWRIDLDAGRVTEEQLDDRPGDFPRVNDDHAGLPTRYGYLTHTRAWADDDVWFDGVVKHDLDTGASQVHTYGDARCGEAAFAPDPDRSAEDGGWLLNFVQDRASGESALVVVDAEALEEVARVHLPRRVPLGFHGNWFAADAAVPTTTGG